MKTATIGRWSVIVGILLAVLAGFIKVPSLPVLLFILGLIVGYLNIKEKETTPFLVAVIALLVIGLSGLQAAVVTPTIVSILSNFVAFISAAGLVVALKEIVTTVTPT